MRWQTLVIGMALTCSVAFIQCAGQRHKPTGSAATKDSASVVDSASSQTASAKPAKLSYEEQQGKVLYTKYCAICHGDQGKGDGFNAYNLDPKPRDFTDPRAMAGIDDATMFQVITEGGKGVNKSPLMPAWGGRMDKLQIEYVIAYVKALEKRH